MPELVVLIIQWIPIGEYKRAIVLCSLPPEIISTGKLGMYGCQAEIAKAYKVVICF